VIVTQAMTVTKIVQVFGEESPYMIIVVLAMIMQIIIVFKIAQAFGVVLIR
jgi:hypothetical protein